MILCERENIRFVYGDAKTSTDLVDPDVVSQVVFAARELFDAADKDGDGKLSPNEIASLVQMLWERPDK